MDAELSEKLEQLRELKRLVDMAVDAIERGGTGGIVPDAKYSSSPYDVILGVRFGIIDFKKPRAAVPYSHADLGAHQAEVERSLKASWKSGFGDEV